jgi:hypothetical protein
MYADDGTAAAVLVELVGLRNELRLRWSAA